MHQAQKSSSFFQNFSQRYPGSLEQKRMRLREDTQAYSNGDRVPPELLTWTQKTVTLEATQMGQGGVWMEVRAHLRKKKYE